MSSRTRPGSAQVRPGPEGWNFHQISTRFATTGSGSDAFKALYKDAFELMKHDPENLGLYFVVGIATRSYVRSYEDQGVTGEFADRAKATLVNFNAKITEALASTPENRLKLLGEVAIDYEWNVHDF
ncbi:hypothetical protein [Variovorax ginsengisoli]|uniref:Uncharacterized protein n=1 Tax=Variovorax ginsengisoli TaxID=363844 RepID=A0ABT8S966_9BURK|nr:hypothetical protein [Variovorax ginsengisoli]MDN8616283.1 hypothetical protein [Variovorax ginsengisoli]MDO1535453.1 hypothetical protein [Variovorax ginsengisoli]